MRTTLTLGKDVAIALERLRKARKSTLKAVVNEALRQGLSQMAAPTAPRRAARTQAVSLGRCLIGSIDNTSEVLAIAEGESFR
jgi:hypothetical protein